MSYPIHPLAELVPEMPVEQFEQLVEDVRAHGLLDPIVLHDGQVLDGRHRQRACEQASIEPRYIEFEGTSPADFVLSKNLARRHLSSSQRAALAVAFLPAIEAEAKTRQGNAGMPRDACRPSVPIGTDGPPLRRGDGSRAAQQAGDLVGVSGRLIGRAKRVARDAPDAFARVKAGELSLDEAERRIVKPADNADGEPLTKRGLTLAKAHARHTEEQVARIAAAGEVLARQKASELRVVTETSERADWLRQLRTARRQIDAFTQALKEV